MKKVTPPAYLPPKASIADTSALQALQRGEADPEQQKRALKWIIEEVCMTYDWPYRPGEDGQRETDIALGRVFCGQQIVKELKINLLNLKGRNKND